MDNKNVDLISLYEKKMIPETVAIGIRDAQPGDIMIVTDKSRGNFDLGSYEIISRREQALGSIISICSNCITRKDHSCVYYIAKFNESDLNYGNTSEHTAVTCNSVFNIIRKRNT